MFLRAANPGEEGALTELVLRSKAHWGYSESFLHACRAELAVTAEQIDQGCVIVASDEHQPIGVAVVELGYVEPELASLFVAPPAMGEGVGGALLRAAAGHAAAAGIEALLIESDPNAESFYLARGARRIGERCSASTGRALPLLRLPTAPALP